jgi:hypothetical protein
VYSVISVITEITVYEAISQDASAAKFVHEGWRSDDLRGLAALLKAVYYPEIGENPKVRIGIGLAVGTEVDGGDSQDSGWIRGRYLAQLFPTSSVERNAEDLGGNTALSHQDAFAVRLKPQDGIIVLQFRWEGFGFSASKRVDHTLLLPINREQVPAVRRHDGARGSFWGKHPGLAGQDIQ